MKKCRSDLFIGRGVGGSIQESFELIVEFEQGHREAGHVKRGHVVADKGLVDFDLFLCEDFIDAQVCDKELAQSLPCCSQG